MKRSPAVFVNHVEVRTGVQEDADDIGETTGGGQVKWSFPEDTMTFFSNDYAKRISSNLFFNAFVDEPKMY